MKRASLLRWIAENYISCLAVALNSESETILRAANRLEQIEEIMDTVENDTPVALQHYLRMWNEQDLTAIRAHLELAVSEDCLWVDPQHAHTGRDALEANIKAFRTRYKKAALNLASNIDGHNNRYRYEWVIKVGSRLLIRGFDVATLNDAGLIERVDGFFGTLERIE